jgi:hypothetical protein
MSWHVVNKPGRKRPAGGYRASPSDLLNATAKTAAPAPSFNKAGTCVLWHRHPLRARSRLVTGRQGAGRGRDRGFAHASALLLRLAALARRPQRTVNVRAKLSWARARGLGEAGYGILGRMVDDVARDRAIYHALKAADEVAAALQAHLVEEHSADLDRAAAQSPSSDSLKLLRQARERLGEGLRAVEADLIAESDQISLRNP